MLNYSEENLKLLSSQNLLAKTSQYQKETTPSDVDEVQVDNRIPDEEQAYISWQGLNYFVPTKLKTKEGGADESRDEID